jgi:hypothetical protein
MAAPAGHLCADLEALALALRPRLQARQLPQADSALPPAASLQLCRSQAAFRNVFTNEITGMVRKLLGQDYELVRFASDMATLDSTFWRATDHLSADQGLVQRAANALGAGDWVYQIRPAYLQKDAEVELQRRAAKYGVTADSLRAAQRRLQKVAQERALRPEELQLQKELQPSPAVQQAPSTPVPAAQRGRNRPPGEEARYQLPDDGMLGNSCGWVGLRAAAVQDLG